MYTPYLICDTLDDIRKELSTALPLGFDVETDIREGFYSTICCAQFYQEGMEEVLIIRFPDPFELTAMVAMFHIIAHNVHYEVTTLQRQTGTRWVPNRMDCTFLLARLKYHREDKFSLDAVFSYMLHECPYTAQGLDKKVLQKSLFNKEVLTDEQLRYAACDVYYLPRLYSELEKTKTDMSYELDMSFLRSCLDFQNNGMPVQEDKRILKMEENFEFIAKNTPKVNNINVNSYKQVREYLGVTESDELALIGFWLRDGMEEAKIIVDLRKAIKQNSFLAKFESDEGRIYGAFKPSARSGRCTSDNQNLQQIPRKLKGVFGTKKGRVLVYADYAQVELRNICAITGCAKMLQLFRDGVDLHNYTRDFIFGSLEDLFRDMGGDLTPKMRAECVANHKRNRDISKQCNFNFLYGGGIPVFLTILLKQAHIIMTEEEGHKIRSKWRKLWKEVFGWQQKGISDWQAGKTNSTILGRKYKAKMMTDYLNIENQGSSAEVAKLAQHYLKPRLASIGKGTVVCDFIHDSWILECDDDPIVYKAASVALAKSMQEAWFEVSKLYRVPDVPMPVSVKVGTNWGDIENDDIPNIWDYELEGMAEYAS